MSSSIGQKPYLLVSTTCDETLLWVIEIWMKNHLVSDSNCNTVILYPSPPITFLKNYKEWQKIALTLSVGDSIPQFTIIIEQDN